MRRVDQTRFGAPYAQEAERTVTVYKGTRVGMSSAIEPSRVQLFGVSEQFDDDDDKQQKETDDE